MRDLLLDVKNFDLDIVVEGDGIKFAAEFATRLNARLVSYARFGTATIMLERRFKIDISSARRESYPKPAQLPVVERGSIKEDLFRRDFTINAMAISINRENFCALIDYFKGKRDLDNRKIRILHSLSFIDDPTRILRAIRFEKRYNFRVEPNTLRRLKEAVRLKMLQKVHPHRLRDDLILMLKEDLPLNGIKRLQQLAGLDFIYPKLSINKKGHDLIRSVEKEVAWFKKAFPSRRRLDAWLIYLAALLDPLKADIIKRIILKFAFAKGDKKRILDYKRCGEKVADGLKEKEIKPFKIFSLLEPLSYEGIILLKAKYKSPIISERISDFLRVYNGMRIFCAGDDLHRLGVKPGPRYRAIFLKVLKAKVNGLVKTREQELSLIKDLCKA